MNTKRVLFVAPRLPYPIDTGGKVRTYNILKRVAEHNRVILLTFAFSKDDEKNSEHIKQLGVEVVLVPKRERLSFVDFLKAATAFSPISFQRYASKGMAKALQEILSHRSIDIVHFDHIHMAQYIDAVPKNLRRNTRLRIDEHNAEHIILKRASDTTDDLLLALVYMREARVMQRTEKALIAKADEVWCVSENDKRKLSFNSQRLAAKIRVVPNGVDLDMFKFAEYTGNEDYVLFFGSFDWKPNVDGAEFFLKDILPLVRAHKPDIKTLFIGRAVPRHLKKYEEARVRFLDAVEDIRPFIKGAALTVVPIRIGGGSRLKILEAMAIGRVVVSTTVGAEGIDYENGRDIVIADTPESFSVAVVKLLNNPDLLRQIGQNARRLIEEKYNWKVE